jgi:transcriptional regulator with XRE-family HTH domain
MDMRKLVGTNLERIRRQKGLTQEELAELSGFSQQYLSTIESGRANPTIVTIYEIAMSMSVHYLDLLQPVPRATRR